MCIRDRYIVGWSADQLPLPGVCITDPDFNGVDDKDLHLKDNTLEFWAKCAYNYGFINENGTYTPTNPQTKAFTYTRTDNSFFTRNDGQTQLPMELLQSIFFEAYNEPFTDEIYETDAYQQTPYQNDYTCLLYTSPSPRD